MRPGSHRPQVGAVAALAAALLVGGGSGGGVAVVEGFSAPLRNLAVRPVPASWDPPAAESWGDKERVPAALSATLAADDGSGGGGGSDSDSGSGGGSREVASRSTSASSSASDPSQSVASSLSTTAASVWAAAQSLLEHAGTLVTSSFYGATVAVRSYFTHSWWSLPFLISAYPLYCFYLSGVPVVSPSWWSMPTLDDLVRSPSAGMIVAGFLLSNISYFLSGLYLLDVIPSFELPRLGGLRERWGKASAGAASDAAAVPSKGRGGWRYGGFSASPLLGILVLASGVCSVVYHTYQTRGPHHLAEAFYYVDHGFAISSILYFFSLCGLPSKKTMTIGTAGLLTLGGGSLWGESGYAWIHSVWHLLSAGTSVSWAHDGLRRGRAGVAARAANAKKAADAPPPSLHSDS